MDEGTPTGSKAKWWSRPAPVRGVAGAEPERDPEQDAGEVLAAQAHAAAPGTATGARATVTGAAAEPAEPNPEPNPEPEPAVAADPAPGQAAEPAPQARPQPLHAPDPYATPPYGGPGPWAPAPPVQRPVPTPPQGTFVPPGAPGTAATNGVGVPTGPAQQPSHHHTQPQPHPSHPRPSHWLQYDPWGAPQQPLTHPGDPVGGVRPRKGRRGALFVGALLIALVAGGIGGGVGAYVERNGGITRVELPQARSEDAKGRAPDSVAGIAASALPSVVTLHVSGVGEQGTGTGFVLDAKGHILTNDHVVEPAGADGTINITFSGGQTAKAKLVGKDSGYDLAVVRVLGVDGLKPLPLGNSENVQVGDPVVAIGAPFDLQNTVTSGIISAKERPITAGGEKGDGSDVSYVNALQTDAPINPGNSGGPLVDAQARVIGINSAIRAADNSAGLEGSQGGSIGLGFAIPINQGKRVAEELINTGKATHPVIGVTLDMKYTGDGARVGTKGADGPAVTPGGPGARAGVRPRDVITEVNGQRVHNGQELIVKIRAHRPGDRLELTVVRAGKERTVSVTLGSADGN
ncbi:protease [Streptomyces agglomeratus]|uniref:Protease n=1 Tax=Streptomyces agglomeratus TaxID=285458 RepID=A0A1E5P6L9_9ACTN|nr:trypsin-like peptidase domain-containing protein [Streptomyces agglomeratus]OEJ25159.1 protease [Streptomyces agglomeratus]OEJ40812.1 protease [Streptomyces agglomeratus]OEJ44807.1 protease [Streptomyces agglomeratus]OEJ53352.1 protease [Streptomyces agglomeratus]OEJ60689.1 protease [Streptomyces agglomeratus]